MGENDVLLFCLPWSVAFGLKLPEGLMLKNIEGRDEEPEVPFYSWNIPDHPWEKLHIDLAGPLQEQNWMLIVDALLNWPEVEPIGRTYINWFLEHSGWNFWFFISTFYVLLLCFTSYVTLSGSFIPKAAINKIISQTVYRFSAIQLPPIFSLGQTVIGLIN